MRHDELTDHQDHATHVDIAGEAIDEALTGAPGHVPHAVLVESAAEHLDHVVALNAQVLRRLDLRSYA